MACKNKIYSILSFRIRLNWFEPHHLYWGLIFAGLSLLMPLWALIPCLALGLYVAGDDIYQHHRQVVEYDPCYHSPVHNFYGKYLYKYKVVRWLNEVVSWLFHNPLILAICVAIIVLVIIMKG